MGNNDEMHVYIKRKKPALGSQEAHHVYTHRREDNQVHVYLPSGQPEPATNPHADILGQDADTGEPTQVSQDAPTAREQEPERYQPPTGYSRLGRDMQTGDYVDVAQAARLRGLYIIGLQGYGKSGLNENLIIQDIKQNIGVCVLDPHGELIKNIIARLPDKEKEEKVILLDLKRKDAYIGLNLFDCADPTDDDEITKTLDLVKHVFEKAFEITQATPLMYNLLYKIAYVLIANPGCTMVDMPLFLTNEAFRKKLVHNVTDYDVRTFWETWDNPKLKSPRDQEADSQTILNKLNDFSHAPLRYIVGQSSSTIDLQTIMDEGKILLVKLDRRRETATALIGSILVALTLTASDARLTKKQFNVYADEFQRFASEDFATLLEEARKAAIGITMAHQNRSQLSAKDKELETDLKDRTRSTDNLVVFRINRKDADDLAGEFAEEPEEAKLDVLTPQKHQRIEEQVEIEVEEDIMEITHDPVNYLASYSHTHPSSIVRGLIWKLILPIREAEQQPNIPKYIMKKIQGVHEQTLCLHFLKGGIAGKDTMWYHKGEKKPLKPRRCPMPVPIICLDDELCHFVERYRQRFSKPQYQYFVIVLVGLMLCEGRRTLLGLVRQVAEASSLAGLSRFLSQAPWDEGELAEQWLEDFRKTMEPAVQAEQVRLGQVQPKRQGRPRVPLVTGYLIGDDSTMHKPKGKQMQGLGKH